MSHQDHYAVLGVAPDAPQTVIKQAYRRLALECHPDRFPDDEDAARRFRAVSEAYGVLGDPSARAKYDRSLRFPDTSALANPMNLPTARELFASVFGDILGQRKRQQRAGRDIRYTLTVSLAEAVLGSSHTIEFEALGACESCEGSGTARGGKKPRVCSHCDGRGEVKGNGFLARRSRCGRCDGTGMVQIDPCVTCRGRGSRRGQRKFSVKVPPGTLPGSERILRGRGEPGRFGGNPGNLRITVNLRPDPVLEREGDHLRTTLPITITRAALGGSVDVATVDGDAVLKIPPGIQSGTTLRMAGRGVPRADGSRGDQLVQVVVETPIALGPEVRELLERLEAATRDEQLPRRTRTRAAMSS